MHDEFRAAVATLLKEVDREREANRLPLEGMRNFMRDATEGQDALLEAARLRARDYEQEISDWLTLESALRASLEALDVIERDQARPKLPVTHEVFAQMQEKIATETAALADVEPLPSDAVAGEARITGVIPA